MRAVLLVVGLTLIGIPVAAAAPANDRARNAMRLDVLPFVHAVDTRHATTAAADPYCAGRGHTVWYTFTPHEDMRLEVNTFGSNYDTTLSAYIVTPEGDRQIDCVDDSVDLLSQLNLNLSAGVRYRFMVGSYGGSSGGDLIATFSMRPSATQLRFTAVGAHRRPGLVTLRGAITCAQPSSVSVWGDVVQTRRVPGDGAGNESSTSWARFWTNFDCSGRTGWMADATPVLHLLARQQATMVVTVVVCGPTACDEYSLADRIALVPATIPFHPAVGDRRQQQEAPLPPKN